MITRTTARTFLPLRQLFALVMATTGFAAGSSHSGLRMPLELPIAGYGVTNAFGNLTFDQPVAIASVPGETNRIFVAEKTGRVIVITNLAAPTKTDFLNATAELSSNSEGGLLGLAFHPGYRTNGFFYIYRTIGTTFDGIYNGTFDEIARYRADPDNPNRALPGSKTRIWLQYDHDPGQHNGGDLQFGSDGYLFVSVGADGPSPAEGPADLQAIDRHFFGSILRIDVDGRPGNLAPNPYPSGVANYWVPADNPFIRRTSHHGKPVDPARLRTELYAIGLRNPWRISFDGNTLYCADVGSALFEEINLIKPGGNYGWPFLEGAVERNLSQPVGFASIPPLHAYSRGSRITNGYCIVGGPVYRGAKIPALFGTYLFGDFVAGSIWGILHNDTSVTRLTPITSVPGLTTFGTDPSNGDVLAASLGGTIWRLIYVEPETTSLPVTLAETGAFADLETLRPAAGLVPYDVAVPFWSDGAIKQRWFVLPNRESKIGFAEKENWTFEPGTIWVKHFELELTEGRPDSRRRLETRFLVKSVEGVYGVTYRWGTSRTNAFLVPDGGMEERFTVNEGGVRRQQTWTYPSRSSCLRCHNPGAGYVLGFNTPQMNCEVSSQTGRTNQLELLSARGYLDTPVSRPESLTLLARTDDSTLPLEHRARSYMQANCAACHYPGGPTGAHWDARITTPIAEASIIDSDALSASHSKIIRSGNPDESIMLHRISSGFARMPPLATSVFDKNGIALITEYARTLPTAPWTRRDVGAPGREGSSSIADGVYRISGSGTNIGGGADAFHFLFQPLPEHGQLIARLVSIDSSAALAGVMVRGSMARDAPFAMVARSAGRIRFHRRASHGADARVTTESLGSQKWLRLVRQGQLIEAFTSPDGEDWTLAASEMLDLSLDASAGLAVCSVTNWRTATAVFDNVSVLGIKLEAPSDGASSLLPATMELRATVQNNGIGVARVEFYNGENLLGEVKRPPYTMLWTSAVEGRHSLTARAIDIRGTSVSSAAVEVEQLLPATRAGRPGADELTKGNWRQKFGDGAYVLSGIATNLSREVAFSINAPRSKIWARRPVAKRALVRPTGSLRTAAAWSTTTNMTVDLGLLDGALHRVALYFVDWEKWNRVQLVEVLDVESGMVLGSNVVSRFPKGVFLTWHVRGRIQIRVTRISGPNAVLSGVFIDPADNSTPSLQIIAPTPQQEISINTDVTIEAVAGDADGIEKVEFFANGAPLGELAEAPFRLTWRVASMGAHTLTARATDQLGQRRESSVTILSKLPTAAADLIRVDLTTQGRWISAYGNDGFAIPGYLTNYPAYAAVDFANATERVYFPENNARDLLRLDRDEHILSVWRVGGPVDFRFLDGSNHVLAVYFLDVERARHQRVTILSADTGERLSEVDLPAFGDGQYLVWQVRGHIKLELVIVQGGEAYISGLFFDQAAPALAFAESSTRLLRAEDGGLVVEIRRRPASDNELLELEFSADLVAWHPTDGEIESTQIVTQEGTQVVTLRLSKTARAAERGFFRARFRPSP